MVSMGWVDVRSGASRVSGWVGGKDSWSIWPVVWEGGSVCMIGGVGLKSIPRSKDGMGES